MPYKIIGKSVYKKINGGWVKVGESKKTKKYLNVLNAIEHGWVKPKK